jgi:hypothetical protein
MRGNNAPVIRITGVDEKPNRFVASLRSEFLDATYAVVFSTTVTGAVALHRFARMISELHGRQAKLQITEDFFAGKNTAVEDILKSIGISEPVSR